MDNTNVAKTAKHLLQVKTEVIQRWEKQVRADFAVAKQESKPHLINSLPQFLDLLVKILTRGELTSLARAEVKRISQEHALDRAYTTQYTIGHILTEYNILRQLLFEVLDEEDKLDKTSRDIVIGFVEAGKTHATCEFAEILFDEERKTRRKLEEKEQVFETIFELSATGNAIIDVATGRFLQVNQRLCQMTGYSTSK